MSVPKHGDTVLVVWTKDQRTGLYDTETFDGEPHIRTADEVIVPIGQGVVSVVPPKPRVICLSGSMRFEEHMRVAAVDLSLEGAIVTGPFVNMKKQDPRWATDELADPIKAELDRLHFRKIDLADSVVVVSDETGYIGDSTRNEIAYAERHGKPVRYVRVALDAPAVPEVSADGLRRAWAERFDALLSKADLLDENDQASVLAVFEDLIAVVAPDLDQLYKAVASWQDLWSSKEEWEQAATAAWGEVDTLKWLHAEAVWRLRGMARRAGDWRRTSAQHYAEFHQAVEDWARNDEQVLAERDASPAQHQVVITKSASCTSAYCLTCKKFTTGFDRDAQDWKDQHVADTLRPQLQANSNLLQPLEQTDDGLTAEFHALVRESDEELRVRMENDPHLSRLRAVLRGESEPAKQINCKQDCPGTAPECFCFGLTPHRICCHDTSQSPSQEGGTDVG